MKSAAYNLIIHDLCSLLHNINHTAVVHAQLLHLAKNNPIALQLMQQSGAAIFIDDAALQTTNDKAVKKLYMLAEAAQQTLATLDNYWRTTPECMKDER